MDYVAYFLSHFVTVLFLIGLAGYVPVVAISWFSILKSEFSSKDDAQEELRGRSGRP
jgi:hypothetical protein